MDARIRILYLLFLLLHLWPVVSYAQEVTVPPNLQAVLFSKVLPFDRNLQSRAKGTIVIGILYQSRFKMSLDIHREFLSAMSKLPTERIADLPYHLVSVDIDEGSVEQSIARDSIDILYIAPLRAVDVEKITKITRTRSVLTLTGVPEYVQQGISVGIGTKAGKPQILINLKSARLEHADFNSQLLKIARIVESEEEQ